MKKLAFAAMALLASVVSAGAQAKVWTYAEVVLTGAAEGGGIFLRLNSIDAGDNTYSNRIFRLSSAIEDIGLAITMAAATSNRQVLVQTNVDEVDSATYPTITGIYLTKEIVSN